MDMNLSVPKTDMPQQEELIQNFNNALQVVDDVVLKNYISKLRDMAIVPLSEEQIKNNISNNVRFFKITEMVYEKDEYSTYKFASVFNALSAANCSVFVIIDSNGEKTDFYMGVRSLDSKRTTSSLEKTLRNAITGQFPGTKTEKCFVENGKENETDMGKILSRINHNNISLVSCLANNRDKDNRENRSFIQGLEKLALSMQGEKYTAIILANGTSQDQLEGIRRGYETIYTQLSPFATTQITYGNNETSSFSQAYTEGKSNSFTFTTNRSYSKMEQSSEADTKNDSETKENMGSKVLKGVSAAAGMLGAVLALPTGGASLAVGGIVSGTAGMLGSAMSKQQTRGTSVTVSRSNSETVQEGSSEANQEGRNESNTDTVSMQNGTNQSLLSTVQDKRILGMLEKIDTQLKRLQEFESLGMWECAAYFMSEQPDAAEIAASTYKAIMRGENSGVEVSAINSWMQPQGDAEEDKKEKKKIEELSKYITNFIHPVFQYENAQGTIEVTPCSLVSGNELALHMGLPRKSVCGFPVIEHADFGKEVVSYNPEERKQFVKLGKVFNMGTKTENCVKLSRESLSMHTFVTGSTGSGKSNTVYELLRQLKNDGISFMVIEPAKGEYKNVFGRYHDVEILGTNPQYSKLLQINPFKFPNKVHILEHIDRLVEIFNVCWPMYAAMPAVLKDAVLQAYEVCGWDLVKSTNRYSKDLFPTFLDLQNELINVIDKSAYSEEVKSNYRGSLITRVKTLTNGLNGQIFGSKEINNFRLFDQNVVVDLSRIGSLETKSLIMGILVMRLNEHRMATAKGMNHPLKHVTVLEEAHNILKRTSTEQDPESSNMAGKSVEMISNAIAEMRTYGEGFIIADQSPNAVDISAIRNTNTKIIMRLPEESDRRLAGKSAALNDEQIDEIAKLPKGVAVVYQNDWIEPVLCNINEFKGKAKQYKYSAVNEIYVDENKFRSNLLKLILKGRTVEELEPNIDLLKEQLKHVTLATKEKLGILKLIEEYEETESLRIWDDDKFELLSELVTNLVSDAYAVDNAVMLSSDFERLTKLLIDQIMQKTDNLSSELVLSVCQCFMKNFSKDSNEKLEIYAAWRNSIKAAVM